MLRAPVKKKKIDNMNNIDEEERKDRNNSICYSPSLQLGLHYNDSIYI
jgi:hypothetical protein